MRAKNEYPAVWTAAVSVVHYYTGLVDFGCSKAYCSFFSLSLYCLKVKIVLLNLEYSAVLFSNLTNTQYVKNKQNDMVL